MMLLNATLQFCFAAEMIATYQDNETTAWSVILPWTTTSAAIHLENGQCSFSSNILFNHKSDRTLNTLKD